MHVNACVGYDFGATGGTGTKLALYDNQMPLQKSKYYLKSAAKYRGGSDIIMGKSAV